MLNVINFLVFRITRTVLYSLQAVMAHPDLAEVVSGLHSQPSGLVAAVSLCTGHHGSWG
jgi:hypothetical protein